MAKPGIKEAWFEAKPDKIITGFLCRSGEPFSLPFLSFLHYNFIVGEKMSF